MENNIEILNKINSGDPGLLATAIKEIQENGDIAIAEALLQTLEKPLDFHLTNAIVNLLSDIRDNNFRGVLIRRLKSAPTSNQRSLFLRIVWESSLDYSAYLGIFLDLLLKDDFTVAIEASTVIENMIHSLTEEQRVFLMSQINESTFTEEKQFLVGNILAEFDHTTDE